MNPMQMLVEIEQNTFQELSSESLLNGSFCVYPSFKMIFAKENDLKSIKSSEWNAFAQECNGSARASYERIANLSLKNLGRHRLRVFEIFGKRGGENIKIGQCALAMTKDRRCVFVDRLQLLPSQDHCWIAAMKAVIQLSKAERFEYGYQLNLEAARERDLALINGVTVEAVRPIVVHAVDFQRWTSWDDYYRSLSENTRRNIKAANRDLPDLRLVERLGRRSFWSIPALIELRADMAKRKGMDLKVARSAFSYLSWIALCPNYVVTSLAVNGRKVLCSYFGVEFGKNTYYLEGASRAGIGGASWRQLITMMQRAYERHPTGKFVMGYVGPEDKAIVPDEGLIRSRAACRVSEYPTSIVRFRYDPAMDAGATTV